MIYITSGQIFNFCIIYINNKIKQTLILNKNDHTSQFMTFFLI